MLKYNVCVTIYCSLPYIDPLIVKISNLCCENQLLFVLSRGRRRISFSNCSAVKVPSILTQLGLNTEYALSSVFFLAREDVPKYSNAEAAEIRRKGPASS